MQASNVRVPARIRVSATVALAVAIVAAATTAAAADRAKGSIALGKHSGTISHVVMVRGPDAMDPGRSVLRLYFSANDISAKVKACKTMSCADQALVDGASVDYGSASHLGYWVGLNGQLAQHSGGTGHDAFKLTTDKPDHLAGSLHIDDSGMGGAKVDAEFDATLAATMASAN